ncbi:MAG: MarR family transcriptional regulator [Gammaproteobacteria bacterium]|jgi:DNA-binding MarR family transcriptional regulator|nr:MAG: MarR family transcriptional regulator [Gammaproteobacteria bacterium]
MSARRVPPPRIPEDAEFIARSPGYRIGQLLRSLNCALRQDFDEVLRRSGVPLSLPQMAVLHTVHLHPGIQGAQVARDLGITPQTTSQLLLRVEQGGYLMRSASSTNARAVCWSLTARGVGIVASAMKAGEPVFNRMVARLTPRDVEQLAALLACCVASLSEPANGTPTVRTPRRRPG